MFRITRDPSSGSFIQCLANITVMVLSCPLIMDVVGVMAAYLPVVSASLDCAVHTRTTGKYAAITPNTSLSTEMIKPLL